MTKSDDPTIRSFDWCGEDRVGCGDWKTPPAPRPVRGSIMGFLSGFLLAAVLSTAAGAQTVEGTATAAASAAFDVIEQSLISEFFKSTGLTPQELEVLGDAASVITGEEALSEAVPLIADEDEDEGQGQSNQAKKKKNKKDKKNKGKSGDLPPGLAKRDSLPPGLANHLEKHGTLPAGLELRELPASLEAQLPDPGPDRKRVVVDDDILLIETSTGRVLDILKDVIGSN